MADEVDPRPNRLWKKGERKSERFFAKSER
jgi:hypothetical protein